MRKLVIHPKDQSTDFLKPIYHGRNDMTVLTGGTKDEVTEAIDKHDHIIMLGHGTPQGLLSVGQFNKPKVKPTSTGGFAPVNKSLLDDLPDDGDDDDWYHSRKVGSYSSSGYKSSHGSVYGGSYGSGYSGSYTSLTTGYVIDDGMVDNLSGKKLTAIWCNADQFMEWNELPGFYTGMFISEPSEAKMIGTADTDKWQIEESNYGFVSVVRRFIDHPSEKLYDALMMEYGEMANRNAVAKYNLKRLYVKGEGNVRMESGAAEASDRVAGKPSLRSA